jgi:hypothetical protein
MDLKLRWLGPFDLVDGGDSGLDFAIEQFDQIPNGPGVYVFSRVHSRKAIPLYIGKAENLQRRVGQQLKNNVRLMRAIKLAPRGYRTVHIAELAATPGQSASKAIRVVESAPITTAHFQGYDLVNIQGKKTLAHNITSTGNREARSWLPEDVIKLRRA